MKKSLLIILGLGILAVGYWTISPLFINRTVNEKLEDIVPQATSEATSTDVDTITNTPTTVTERVVPITPSKPTSSAAPTTSASASPTVLAQGTFVGLQDHNAEGSASLITVGEKTYVRFEENFKVTNGPDLFVYLGKNGTYDPAARLAALKGNIGAQNYEIPASIDVKNYNEVWVWCRAFSVAFGKAQLID